MSRKLPPAEVEKISEEYETCKDNLLAFCEEDMPEIAEVADRILNDPEYLKEADLGGLRQQAQAFVHFLDEYLAAKEALDG